jgi:hypothetical protein
MSTPSGGWLVTNGPAYVEEATYNVFPTNPESINWIGIVDNFDPKADLPPIAVRGLGSEDVQHLIKGIENYDLTIDYALQNTDFLKYAINAQGAGAGSIDKSLSLALGIKLGASTYYYKFSGGRPNSVTITGKPGEAHKVSVQMLMASMGIPTTTDPKGTGAWETPVTTAPWTFTSVASNPVTVGGTGIPTSEISVTVNRNLDPIRVIGNGQIAYLPPKQREITANISLAWLDTNRYTDLQNYTARDLVWTLNSGNTLTLSECKFHRLDSFTLKPTETIYEKYQVTALAAALV